MPGSCLISTAAICALLAVIGAACPASAGLPSQAEVGVDGASIEPAHATPAQRKNYEEALKEAGPSPLFDCDSPEDDIERAICARAELSALHDRISDDWRRFEGFRRGVDQHRMLVLTEHEWFGNVERKCGSAVAKADLVPCLSDALGQLADRIEYELEKAEAKQMKDRGDAAACPRPGEIDACPIPVELPPGPGATINITGQVGHIREWTYSLDVLAHETIIVHLSSPGGLIGTIEDTADWGADFDAAYTINLLEPEQCKIIVRRVDEGETTPVSFRLTFERR